MLDKIGAGEGVQAPPARELLAADRQRGVQLGGLRPRRPGIYYNFDDQYWMLAPTIDVAWVRAIGDSRAWQIGLNAGLGVGVSGPPVRGVGRVTPLFSLFTGFRFWARRGIIDVSVVPVRRSAPMDKPHVYNEAEVTAKIAEHQLAGWYLDDGWLKRRCNTAGWPQTLMLVNAVGYLCGERPGITRTCRSPGANSG
ncbi:MAG: hypothetical protein U0797_02760 [Gemmataceae bacterium]